MELTEALERSYVRLTEEGEVWLRDRINALEADLGLPLTSPESRLAMIRK